jgi:hypothetical protein
MANESKYQLVIQDIDTALEKTWDWLGETIESIIEGGWKIVEEFFRDLVGEFLKHVGHAIVNFVQNPIQPLQALQGELHHFVSSVLHHLTNPFSSPDAGFNMVALLWAAVGFLFELLTGAPLPFDVPGLNA